MDLQNIIEIVLTSIVSIGILMLGVGFFLHNRICRLTKKIRHLILKPKYLKRIQNGNQS